MRILILGAGALGSLIGAGLHRYGYPVVLYSTNRAHISAISDKGLVLEKLSGEEVVLHPPACADIDELPWIPELVLTLVKSRNTTDAVRYALPACSINTSFLTLQNGIGNAEAIRHLVGGDRVLAGTTAQGATLVGPGRVRHGGQGPTHIGRPGANADDLALQTAKILDSAGFPCQTTNEVDHLIWKKLLVNVGINAITAVARVPNGWIADNPSAGELAEQAVVEAREVAARYGFSFAGEVAQEVLQVADRTRSNHSSMYQDVAAGKPSEIEAINGAVEKMARACDMQVPVNWALTRLIRLMDAVNAQEGGRNE